ncbi:transposase [candidate division KSB1 bacterium]|nr:transposase [candidate division KSB1 bacterium]NIR69894.1 transposase [candidate division KSB1 bacterium]NIS25095.1 transposase [candidate division KSB1 bacterium]NIT72688.1 transposase [candidate division KSB1 bacterium]NIU25794.1 transposase [candidate division KSB1 bacterium]
MRQHLLFSVQDCLDVKPLESFQLLFEHLHQFQLTHTKATGRKPIQREAILQALIFKSLKSISTLTELRRELHDNPSAALCCGFDIRKPIPSVERFSAFLRETENKELAHIRNQLVHQLIELSIIDGKYSAIDSCPILANVKENNLKTNVKNRFDKTKPPKGDLDVRLGVIITFPQGQKKVQFFWGYRNHVVSDAKTELPLWEITKPANVHDSTMFIPIFDLLQKEFHFDIQAVMADAIYDTASILKYIRRTLAAKPRVARNPRNTQRTDEAEIRYAKSGNRICEAGLEMLSRGTFYDKSQDRWRQKWVCPLHHSRKVQQHYMLCPVFHPKFFSQKGCYAYKRIDDDIRKEIDYGSESFKKDANLRTSSERIFSRLLSICMQNPSVVGLNATANHCTIAHITVLLVALTAAKNDVKEQIRFIKSFLPNFNP